MGCHHLWGVGIILPATVGFSDNMAFEQGPSKEVQESHVDIWG